MTGQEAQARTNSWLCCKKQNPKKRNKAIKKLIPKEKPGKRARKQLDNEQHIPRAFSPVTKKEES